jgi:uncharacterized protein YidB (DUF937 family)
MGLLDGLLGQVLGGMAQGGNPAPRGADPMRGGGMGGMGGLGDLLNSLGGGGMPSPGGAAPGGMGGGMGGMGGAALGSLLMMALSMLQKSGGIDGVLGRLREAGHGAEADSWVSTGQNLPIDPSALSKIFGHDQISEMARETGLSPQQAQGGLAALFPEIVNQMTPQGRVEAGSDDVVQQALAQLQRARRG